MDGLRLLKKGGVRHDPQHYTSLLQSKYTRHCEEWSGAFELRESSKSCSVQTESLGCTYTGPQRNVINVIVLGFLSRGS